jgi:beta-N-acetylhexosaminidase
MSFVAKRASLYFVALLSISFISIQFCANAAEIDRKTANQKSLRAMIGQMILVGFVGNNVEDKNFIRVREQAANGEITGVIYLKRNIGDRKTVRLMNDQLQAATNSARPLLTAVDQEGGKIQRLSIANGFPPTQSAKNVARNLNEGEALAAYSRMAANLRAWGFNLNFGPVVDLDINENNPIIGRLGRSYSKDPQIVVRYAAAFIKGHREHGVLTALKHFPGHGSSLGDSHKGVVNVTSTWKREELSPYKDLINGGYADIVMSSHVVNANLDPKGGYLPSSLSKATLTGVLKGQLGFGGVVISDDLQMSAIADTHSLKDAVIQSVMAGNDILVFANDKNPDPLIAEKVADILVKEADADKELLNRIAEASSKVQTLKDKWSKTYAVDLFRTKSINKRGNGEKYVLVTPEYFSAMARQTALATN